MRRALRYAAIWCGATAVAVSVSWFGVRGVLGGGFDGDVRLLPFEPEAVADGATPTPPWAVTRTPERRTAGPSTSAPSTSAPSTSGPAAQRPRRSSLPTKTPAAGGGELKVVTVRGGEVAFRLGAADCRLVSATPATGYTAKVTRATGWIRVDLARGEHGTGVWCIGHERRTDTWEY